MVDGVTRWLVVTRAGVLPLTLTSGLLAVLLAAIAPESLERSVQLIHRSNQFNLTTRRHSAAEVQAMLESDSWITLTVSLRDRFGDNGLISVLLAKISGDAIDVDGRTMRVEALDGLRVAKVWLSKPNRGEPPPEAAGPEKNPD